MLSWDLLSFTVKKKLQNIPTIITSFIHPYLELYYTLEGCNELFNICM